MTPPTIGVLALQGDTDEHRAVLDGLGARTAAVLAPEHLEAVDALVIPGGESTTMSKLAVRYGLIEPLRARIARGMPVYGTCAGMILLSDRVLGGTADQVTVGGIDMTVRRNAFGRQTESFETPVGIDGIGEEPFDAVFIRAPWVDSVGPRVSVLGRLPSEDGAGRIVAVRQGSLMATSFHPELTGDARVHRLFVDIAKGHS